MQVEQVGKLGKEKHKKKEKGNATMRLKSIRSSNG